MRAVAMGFLEIKFNKYFCYYYMNKIWKDRDLSLEEVAMRDRLQELDGLRGVAILTVMAYHFLGRFPEYYPYDFTAPIFLEYGRLGVNLFFIISGFVISMTLVRSPSLIDFGAKRIGRLLPPMVVCSIATFLILHMIDTPFTNARRVGVTGFLPSWTFLTPNIWQKIVPEVQYIDGAYWTLFVEVRFYALAAFFAFAPFFRRFSIAENLCGFFLVAYGLRVAFTVTGYARVFSALDIVFFTDHLYLFVSGSIFYEIFFNGRKLWKYTAIALTYSMIFFVEKDKGSIILITIFYFIFIVLVFRRSYVKFLAFKPLTFVGAISYSTYLLHQNIGVTLITLLPKGLGTLVYLSAFVFVAAFVGFLGWLSYHCIEKRSGWFARQILSIHDGLIWKRQRLGAD